MKEIRLSNEYLTAIVATKGAELTSLKKDEVEYIWQADTNYWARHAPILFPIVGKLKGDTYYYSGKSYHMKQHGFARDIEFDLLEQKNDRVSLVLQSNAKTLAYYPFKFELIITHSLKKNKLITAFSVKNIGSKDLFFSIGAHPAYNCPLKQGHKREDYILRFDDATDVKSKVLKNGTVSFDTKKVLVNKQDLVLSKDAFIDDAVVFDPNPFRKATLIHKESNQAFLEVHFQAFPYLGVWSKNENAPFVCVEPWFGIADYENHNQELRTKKGIMKLEKCTSFEYDYAVKIL